MRRLVQASVRTFGSRSKKRLPAAATNFCPSAGDAFVAPTPALSSSGLSGVRRADRLQMAEGVPHELDRRAFFEQSFGSRSSESTSATASNSTDGVPGELAVRLQHRRPSA